MITLKHLYIQFDRKGIKMNNYLRKCIPAVLILFIVLMLSVSVFANSEGYIEEPERTEVVVAIDTPIVLSSAAVNTSSVSANVYTIVITRVDGNQTLGGNIAQGASRDFRAEVRRDGVRLDPQPPNITWNVGATY